MTASQIDRSRLACPHVSRWLNTSAIAPEAVCTQARGRAYLLSPTKCRPCSRSVERGSWRGGTRCCLLACFTSTKTVRCKCSMPNQPLANNRHIEHAFATSSRTMAPTLLQHSIEHAALKSQSYAAHAASVFATTAALQAVLLDQFGVLHDGRRAHPAALSAVAAWADAGVKLYILSNSSRRAGTALEKISQYGFRRPDFAGAISRAVRSRG